MPTNSRSKLHEDTRFPEVPLTCQKWTSIICSFISEGVLQAEPAVQLTLNRSLNVAFYIMSLHGNVLAVVVMVF